MENGAKFWSRNIYLSLLTHNVSVLKYTAFEFWTFTGPTDTCSCSSTLAMREKCVLFAVPGTVPM
jgi:hypothetical protein